MYIFIYLYVHICVYICVYMCPIFVSMYMYKVIYIHPWRWSFCCCCCSSVLIVGKMHGCTLWNAYIPFLTQGTKTQAQTVLSLKWPPRKVSKKDNFNVKKPTSTCERKWKKRTQRHSNDTKAQGFEIIVGKMHGWTYGEILIYCCFSDKGHRGITAKCTLYDVFPSSHASRWDAHSGDGTCFAICVFLEGKAQRHNDTKGQTSDFGRWHNLCFNRGQGTEAEGKRIWLHALAECMVGHTLKSLYTDFLTKSTKA